MEVYSEIIHQYLVVLVKIVKDKNPTGSGLQNHKS